jgi:hypothetical protein
MLLSNIYLTVGGDTAFLAPGFIQGLRLCSGHILGRSFPRISSIFLIFNMTLRMLHYLVSIVHLTDTEFH